LIWSLRSKLSENLVENLSKAYGMDDCLSMMGKFLQASLLVFFYQAQTFIHSAR